MRAPSARRNRTPKPRPVRRMKISRKSPPRQRQRKSSRSPLRLPGKRRRRQRRPWPLRRLNLPPRLRRMRLPARCLSTLPLRPGRCQSGHRWRAVAGRVPSHRRCRAVPAAHRRYRCGLRVCLSRRGSRNGQLHLRLPRPQRPHRLRRLALRLFRLPGRLHRLPRRRRPRLSPDLRHDLRRPYHPPQRPRRFPPLRRRRRLHRTDPLRPGPAVLAQVRSSPGREVRFHRANPCVLPRRFQVCRVRPHRGRRCRRPGLPCLGRAARKRPARL